MLDTIYCRTGIFRGHGSIVKGQILGPNPRKYHARELQFSAICENIMSTNNSCPAVCDNEWISKETRSYEHYILFNIRTSKFVLNLNANCDLVKEGRVFFVC